MQGAPRGVCSELPVSGLPHFFLCLILAPVPALHRCGSLGNILCLKLCSVSATGKHSL